MENLWSLAGLSVAELLRRTARESWEDSVFGQGGRMAFYQFLALFPSLFLFLAIMSRVPHVGGHVSSTVGEIGGQVLPAQVSQLLREITTDLNRYAISGTRFFSACAGALWAAFNSTWAMMYGLNRAYEVQEHRSWWQMSVTIAVLTFVIGAIGVAAVLLIVGGVYLENHLLNGVIAVRILEWFIVAIAVYLFFAVLYRFAPDVADHEWRWSTPGALCALIIWIGSIFAARFYFEYVNDYSRSYGYLNGAAILLLWLYVSNGAILIGGEMNSEIEKAAAQDRARQE
ncbi:MAG TPA: YihY/virulence factor BrkB family protein [Bryobacteraceae bacterium]|nr:YihY/virulence factor BrkB family protein [Bryobacteraceae bacterium]